MYFFYLYQELCLVMTILTVAGDNSNCSNGLKHKDFPYICNDDVMELHLNQTASAVYDIVVTFNGTQIAESTNVETMKWHPDLSETYMGRLTLSNPNNLTINLRYLTTMDTGTYNADVMTKKGRAETKSRKIIVRVAPVVNGEFSITMKEDGQNNIFTCGYFSDLGKPPVTFKWNITNSSSHSIRLPNRPPLHCSAVGPAVETCGMNLTAVYQEENLPTQEGYPVTVIAVVIGVVVIVITVITVIVVRRKSQRRTEEEERREPMFKEESNQMHDLRLETGHMDRGVKTIF